MLAMAFYSFPVVGLLYGLLSALNREFFEGFILDTIGQVLVAGLIIEGGFVGIAAFIALPAAAYYVKNYDVSSLAVGGFIGGIILATLFLYLVFFIINMIRPGFIDMDE